jgi:hypothetical protein
VLWTERKEKIAPEATAMRKAVMRSPEQLEEAMRLEHALSAYIIDQDKLLQV